MKHYTCCVMPRQYNRVNHADVCQLYYQKCLRAFSVESVHMFYIWCDFVTCVPVTQKYHKFPKVHFTLFAASNISTLLTDDQLHRELVDQSGQWPVTYNIYWRFTIHLTVMMTSIQVVQSISQCHHKQSFPWLHSPGRSYFTDLWVTGLYSKILKAFKTLQ